MAEIIDELFKSQGAILEYLMEAKEYTFVADLQRNFPKVLLLASASYCEKCVLDCIVNVVNLASDSDEVTVEFVKNKSIERQYHTYFSWRDRNANQFWGLFGGQFKKYAQALVKEDETLSDSVVAFLQLGDMRNGLVHENYAAVTLDVTTDDVYSLFRRAEVFLDRLPAIFDGYAPEGPGD